MKRPDHGIACLAGAGLMLLVGIFCTISSLQRYPAQKGHMERKLADLRHMAVYQQAHDRDLSAVRVFDDLPADRPTDLSTLLRERLPGIPAEVRRRETRPAWGEWQAHRMEVSFERIPLDQLGRILVAAEQQRPPWRLVEASILAAEQQPGAARATLVFEGLARR